MTVYCQKKKSEWNKKGDDNKYKPKIRKAATHI